MAPFWTSWYDDTDLVLPAGSYRVFAVVDYGIGECPTGGPALTAEIRLEVVEPGATPSARP